jgi:hypothetical protein
MCLTGPLLAISTGPSGRHLLLFQTNAWRLNKYA